MLPSMLRDARDTGVSTESATEPYYQDGAVTLYLGDCRRELAWVGADVMVTDPPFGMAYSSGWLERPIAGDSDTGERDAALDLWGEKPALVFGRWSCDRPKCRTLLVWDKGEWPGMGDLRLPWGPSTEEIYVMGGGFTGRRTGSVIRVDRERCELHPNQKPVKLLSRLIMKCPPGVVADPFAGVGTTLVAAKSLGRKAIGVEIDERYCEIAAERLRQGVMDFGAA